jgi:hypothetical protein
MGAPISPKPPSRERFVILDSLGAREGILPRVTHLHPPNFFTQPLSPGANLRHKAPMTQDNTLQIKLRLKGGSGPNANWHWEIQDAAGKVVKSGSAVGPEHKAFTTARVAKEKLEQSTDR